MPFDTISSKQSIYKLCRELKKEEHSLFNCLSSIVDDAAFCSEIRVLYPDLPLLANLRCGLWYAPRPDGTCYFKSTDGHQHNQTFSTTRLNWHVAEIAARKGGCIVVDATRKGKRAPDAMSKTIPIWAAVLNRAVARVRLHDAQKEQRRRSYTTQDGDVLTPVADTQTSISVRTDEPCSSPGSAAAAQAPQLQIKQRLQFQQQQLVQQQYQQPSQALPQQQQQQQASSTCSSATEVEELLLDCLGDSCMELLSAGLTIAVAHPGTPEQAHIQHMYSQLQRSSSCAAVGGSPTARASVLHRRMSLHISPQPSLQEWLDETDVLHRLALLHHDCISPARRVPRISCHSIGRNGNSTSSVLNAAGHVPAALFASSAPASSCLLGSSPPHSSGCVRAFADDNEEAVEATAGQDQKQQQQLDHSRQKAFSMTAAPVHAAAAAAVARQPEPAGFSICTADAAEPVTPRLGCCGAVAATFDHIHEALQDQQQPATAAAAVRGSAGPVQQQLCQLEKHDAQWGLPLPVIGPPSVGSAVSQDVGGAAGEPGADFAFPPPYQLAQSVTSSSVEESSSMGRHGGAAGCCSSMSTGCGANGLALPEMPVVVLNGTSHQPGDAASILDIWRSTDLEDVATLPGINDFRPGVYHIPAERDADDEEADEAAGFRHVHKQQLITPPPQPQHASSSSHGACSSGWVLVDGQEAAAGASVGSSTESAGSWMDEETGVGYDGLCAFAPPPLAVQAAAAAAADDSNSACSASIVERLPPGSPSAYSSCSSDSELSNTRSKSAGAAQPAADNAAAGEVEWDTALHLPLWVPAHERQAIEAKLDGWVERLLEVGADVRGLAAQLRKPLRPLWVTQDSLIWTNQVAHPSSLPFTPLLLVSASQPRQCQRQAARAYGASAAIASDLGGLDDLRGDNFPGSSSSSKVVAKLGRSPSRSASSGEHNTRGSSSSDAQLSSWSYVYVPGAGDDEESWAAGLTPGLFWDNCEALLSCGPAGIGSAVKQLLAHHRSLAYGRGGSSSTGQQLLQLVPHRVCGSPPAHALHVHADRHHPAPKGCGGGGAADGLYAEAAAAGLKVMRAAPGVYWLGSTGLALGNLEGATAADVWRTVDAVLCCGTALSPALQQEYQAMQLQVDRLPAVPAASDAGALGAGCGSAPGDRPGLNAAAGLCFKPTYSWQGSSHALELVSSSHSNCSEWARQHRQQQQQHQQEECRDAADGTNHGDANTSWPAGTAAEAGSKDDSLLASKLDVPAAPRQVKRKGGMLTELLSKSKPVQQQVAAAAHAQQPHGRQAGRSRGHHAHTSSVDSVSSIASCGVAASESSTSSSDSNCSSTYFSTSSDDLAGQQLQLPRLKWLPVECSKRDRSSLKQHLHAALEFVSAHLAAGHLVLLHDVDGHDNCVCMAVAMLLACFTPPDAAASAAASATAAPAKCGPQFVAGWKSAQKQEQQQQLPPELVSKHSVRQRLALVSSCYPAARPTRGSLKQVFNFFEERRRADTGSYCSNGTGTAGGRTVRRAAAPSSALN